MMKGMMSMKGRKDRGLERNNTPDESGQECNELNEYFEVCLWDL